jgi:NAD(P)-dependent dehydrogenase (short-subunit alcohol dehydrogenase family)
MNANSNRKVCLFTGAGGPLGEMFCRMFGASYDIVAVLGRRVPQIVTQHQWWVDPLMPNASLAENRSSVYAIQADLMDETDLRRVIEVTLARFERIDVLVNAAAVGVWAPMLDDGRLLESAKQQFETHVILPLRLGSLIADYFWRDREAENRQYNRAVVNISSTAGIYIYPGYGQSIYSASKAALNYLSMHMGDEFSNIGVRVNALAPTSFPSLIPTETAAEGIRRLAESDANGRILILDVNGERWV